MVFVSYRDHTTHAVIHLQDRHRRAELRFYSRLLSDFEIRQLSRDFVFFDDLESGDLSAWTAVSP